MKRLLNIVLITLVAYFISCKNGNTNDANYRDNYKGGNKVIRIAELSTPISLFPHNLTHSSEGVIVSQIHEGLVKINPKDLSITPGIAEKWEISPSGKKITFHLRKGVKFQNVGPIAGKSIEVTSKDVKFTFELLCSNKPENLRFYSICKDRIVGANEYYKASKGQNVELTGFKIIDDYTFSIELLNSPTTFLEIISNPSAAIICKEAYEAKKEDSNVGLGPFILDEKSSTKKHYVLYKNSDYYAKDKDGKHLPLIDSVIIDILGTPEEALEKFEEGKYDFSSAIPSNQLKDLVKRHIKDFQGKNPNFILDQRPEMVSTFYLININKAPLNNLKLRQAINYAVDKDKIIERAIFGQAYASAVYGIVPPVFNFYKINQLKGYSLNLAKAKQLLKEAGYPNGRGLPEIQLLLNSGNSRNNSVAVEVQKQLKDNLNINVTFEFIPDSGRFDKEINGKGDIYRQGWIADFPSPESFLSIFYGEQVSDDTAQFAYPNAIRYKNPLFDKYYKLGKNAINKDSSSFYFLKAEQIVLDDAPLIPLWYDNSSRLISKRVKNFHSNPIRYFDLTQVDIINDKK
jgi:oligopeptide transport system substrate-binding protein